MKISEEEAAERAIATYERACAPYPPGVNVIDALKKEFNTSTDVENYWYTYFSIDIRREGGIYYGAVVFYHAPPLRANFSNVDIMNLKIDIKIWLFNHLTSKYNPGELYKDILAGIENFKIGVKNEQQRLK